MRETKRIERIVKLLQKAWELEPDWRLGQLMSNLLGAGPHDIFHPEDDRWELSLIKFIEKRER